MKSSSTQMTVSYGNWLVLALTLILTAVYVFVYSL